MIVTLYHNPKCSKSRETLEIIQALGIEPIIVEYLKTPLSAEQIAVLICESGISVQQALRTDVEVYTQQVAGKTLSDEELIQLMAENPSLLNRPFASSSQGTRFCRPPELVKEIL
ncbi:arsenate reductase (glutaredoxin) [Vespertiliibacter pulmonis]|uniref:Arsenate reductase n=1 Tax=Vespertiliibacter pulmonis TaxID=1443036 RepID=A0A3N4VLW1_9PAST|nr:arsenate reductase (glutaredoxin) [Vespertiliibacter pulmonis]QLB21033.1 arsenate reductase (glutaredoxin) [Vespertiliibacter pulmonis]RPE83868.1 arsenate reductase [Vespertiliibacter pulmonis]